MCDLPPIVSVSDPLLEVYQIPESTHAETNIWRFKNDILQTINRLQVDNVFLKLYSPIQNDASEK